MSASMRSCSAPRSGLCRLAILALALAGCAQQHARTDAALGDASDDPEGRRGDAMEVCSMTAPRSGWLLAITRAPATVCGGTPDGPVLALWITEPELEEGRRYEIGGTWVLDVESGVGEEATGVCEVLEYRPGARVRVAFDYTTASGERIEGVAVLESFCSAPAEC